MRSTHSRRLLAFAIFVLVAAPAARTQDADRAADIRVDVDVVQTSVSITRHGIPVKGLTRDDFKIREDNVPQVVKYFWQEHDLPLSIGLIVDVSPSQAGLIAKHRDTVTKFLRQVLGPGDKAMLITVGPQARLITDFTTSIDQFGRGIDRIRMKSQNDPILGEPCRGTARKIRLIGRRRSSIPCGGTALWQGVYVAASQKMKPVQGRKALIRSEEHTSELQ